MLDSLPEEVFFEILSRLPVKEIIRSRCVSKTWCSLISSPNFITTHLNRSLSNPEHSPYLLRLWNDGIKMERFTLHSSGVSLFSNNFTELRTSDQIIYMLSIITGSSNGLLCLSGSFWGPLSRLYVLWNPSIQKAVILPKPDVLTTDAYVTSVGFGHLPKTDDYKLVRLVIRFLDCRNPAYGIADWVQIYTLQTHAWRTVRIHGPPYHMRKSNSAAFLHGALHWAAYIEQHNGERRHVILSFDLADEAFREVGMPESLQNEAYRSDAAVLDGLIALVHDPDTGQEPRTVWVMKEYGVVESWTKLFDIKILDSKMRFHSRVMGFRENGEVLLQIMGHLFSYEPSSQRIERLSFIGPLWLHFLDKYVESLVLLNAPNTGLLKPT